MAGANELGIGLYNTVEISDYYRYLMHYNGSWTINNPVSDAI